MALHKTLSAYGGEADAVAAARCETIDACEANRFPILAFAEDPPPTFIVDHRGRIAWRNRAAGADLTLAGHLRLGDELAARKNRLHAEILATLATAATGDGGEIHFAMSDAFLYRRREMRALVKRCAPAPAPSEEAGAFVVLLARVRIQRPNGRAAGPNTLFTPVEQRLAHLIVGGRNVREAAADMKISYHTARKYLQAIFQKTGVHRQTELVALLSAGPHAAERRLED